MKFLDPFAGYHGLSFGRSHAALFPLHGNHPAIIAGESGLDLAAKTE